MNTAILAGVVVMMIVIWGSCSCVEHKLCSEYINNRELQYINTPVIFTHHNTKVVSDEDIIKVPSSQTAIRNITEEYNVIRPDVVGDGDNDAFSNYTRKKIKDIEFKIPSSLTKDRVSKLVDESFEARRSLQPY
jgi:hypothetical protein